MRIRISFDLKDPEDDRFVRESLVTGSWGTEVSCFPEARDSLTGLCVEVQDYPK
jgi:hypothetical protein